MKRLFTAAVVAAAVALPVHSAPLKDSEYFTMHSMGCMLLRECVEDVKEVKSISDISIEIPATNYDIVAVEFDSLVRSLNKVGAKVFLADQKYFPVGHRGVYHTVSNNFFLNKAYMNRPGMLMSVMRHEGWHAAQDCMAGTIDNSLIAIILPEDSVPPLYQEIVKSTYRDQPGAIPWEKEAYWAGKTEGMTAKALESCARGTMWTDYEPTPLTRKYLVEEGYISK
jgi:hypothetical protein